MISGQTLLQLPTKTQPRQFQVAYNDTFILLLNRLKESAVAGKWLTEPLQQIYHINSSSDILGTYKFQEKVPSFLMVNAFEVMVPQVTNKTIRIINLEKQSERNISFDFQDNSYNLKMFFFSEPSLFCIKESVPKEQFPPSDKIQLTYLQTSGKMRRVAKFDLQFFNLEKSKAFKYRDYLQKGNNHSLLIFFESNEISSFDLLLHDLVENGSNFESRTRKIFIPLSREINFFSIDMWETQTGKLMYVPPQLHQHQQDKVGFIDLKDNDIIPFDCPLKQVKNSVKAYFLRDYICLKEAKVNFDAFDSSSNSLQVISLPSKTVTYYENNTKFKGKQQVCEYDDSFLLQFVFDEVNSELKIRRLFPCEMKDFYMQCLLHVNQDFDDDLLQESLQILDLI